MSNDLALVFARIHADYRAAIEMTVRSLPPDALDALALQFQAEQDDARSFSMKHLPDAAWPVASAVRSAVKKEIKRRAAAEAEAEAGS